MRQIQAAVQSICSNLVVYFFAGASILCIFSTIQKIIINAPLVLQGYIIPVCFGGASGLIFYLWNTKLRKSHEALQKSYDKLDAKVFERTKDLEKLFLEHRKIGERYRSIFDQSPISIEFYNEEGSLIDVNTACLNMFGVKSLKELRGFNLFDDQNLPQEQKEGLKSGRMACYQTALSFEKVKESKLYATSRSGHIHIAVLITPLGKPIAGYLVQIQDITEYKQAALALQESEMRWKFALEGPGDGVWDWNPISNRVFFSTRWKEMLGYSEDEIGDSLDEWKSRLHPKDKPFVYEDIEAHLRGETAAYQNEHRVLCKDGRYKWILDRGKVVEWDKERKPKRVIGTHSDISERKQFEDEREKLIIELENALAKVKTLSGFLPICASCKKIRNDKGYWDQIESYISEHSDAKFSHSICPDCAKKLYPDIDVYEK